METELMQKKQQQTGKKWEQQQESHPAVPYSYLFSRPEARRDVYTCGQKQTLCLLTPTFHIQLYPPRDPKLYHWR